MSEQGYNPFAPKAEPVPKLTRSQEGILQSIDEELARPDAEEKTMRNPAMEAARKPLEEEEIIEGELIEEGGPTLEGFQQDRDVMQERQARAQEATEGAAFGLGNIDPGNPASLKEGTKRVMDSFIGSPEAQKALEVQLGLHTGKLSLERGRLEMLIKDKVAIAARAFRSKVKPTFQIVDELRKDIAKIAAKL